VEYGGWGVAKGLTCSFPRRVGWCSPRLRVVGGSVCPFSGGRGAEVVSGGGVTVAGLSPRSASGQITCRLADTEVRIGEGPGQS
jgi:hypothetical protein